MLQIVLKFKITLAILNTILMNSVLYPNSVIDTTLNSVFSV